MLLTLPIPSPFPTAPSYCDASGAATEQYPFNPNGSPEGIAALCSPDGRHLAMMPHPERCFMMWQNPWWVLLAPGPGCWLRTEWSPLRSSVLSGPGAFLRPWGCRQAAPV